MTKLINLRLHLTSMILIVMLATKSVFAETLSGRVTVIDGDTLEMHGQRIRLHGIDALESGQSCADKNGAIYRCGQISANQMATYVRGKTVNCNVTDRDRYDRLVAACFVNGEDINERLVFEGWALAYRQYSRDYVHSETHAKRNSAGMWQGRFVEPWKWRKGSRLASTKQEKSGDCVIKGNISNSGKIYHTPESPWYSRTKINTQKGERWFCNEAEAEAAGWRAPRR